MGEGIDLGKGCFENSEFASSSELIPSLEGSRRDVREVIVIQYACTMTSTYHEGAVQQDCESFILSQLPTDRFDIQALYLLLSADGQGRHRYG
jgi:hypothetical protein